MDIQELKELSRLLNKFAQSDTFGLGEIEYLAQINSAIEIVDSAIINLE